MYKTLLIAIFLKFGCLFIENKINQINQNNYIVHKTL
jgi:hypothetical protein